MELGDLIARPWPELRSLLIAGLAIDDCCSDEKVRTIEAVLDQAHEHGKLEARDAP